MPTEYTESRRTGRAWEITANVAVAAFFGFFAYSFAEGYFATYRVSLLLLFIKETCDAVFYLCRKMPAQVTFRMNSWIMAFGGTVMPMMLRPADVTDSFSGNAVQYCGLVLQVAAILSLNRSFGIVPAHRGIKTTGMYRFVRHPLYCAYTIAGLGFIMNNLNLKNVAIFAIGLAFQVVRLFREEEFLSQDPDYVAYTRATRWRLAPFIF